MGQTLSKNMLDATLVADVGTAKENAQTALNTLAAVDTGTNFKGYWTPGGAVTGSPVNGDFYIASQAGSSTITGSAVNYNTGDRIVYNGSAWIFKARAVVVPLGAITMDNLEALVKKLIGQMFTDYEGGFVIKDLANKIGFRIRKNAMIEGKFDLSRSKVEYDILSEMLKSLIPASMPNADYTGYLFLIKDLAKKIAFGIMKDGTVVAKIKLQDNTVLLNMLHESVRSLFPTADFTRLNALNSLDFIPGDDDNLTRGTEVEVPQKTLVSGIVFNRLPGLKSNGLRGVNDTGVDLELRKSTGIVVAGKRNRGDYTPPTTAQLITYKGLFRSDASALPTSPATGDYYTVVFFYSLSSPQTLFGVSMSHWDTLYWNGTAWQTITFPMSNAQEGDFRTITAAGRFLNIDLAIGDRLIYTGIRANAGFNDPVFLKQKTGEFFCMGDFNPASFAPASIRDNDLYVANAAGTFDSTVFAKGDYLIRISGAWGKSASNVTTLPAGKSFDLPCANPNEYAVRRADVSSTVVNFKPKTNVTLAIRRPSADLALWSDSMFGQNVGAAIAAQMTDRTVTTFSYGGGTSTNILTMMKANIRSTDSMRGRTHVFWHGQNNQTDLTQIKAAALEFAALCATANQRYVLWSMLGQQIFTFNGTRLVDANHEDAFNRVNNSRFVELEDWYDQVFPGRHFATRKAALASAEAVPSLHFPGMTERQVADTYGITPARYHVILATDSLTPEMLNFQGYHSAAGLPTGGNNLDYYLRTANGIVGEILVKVSGTWKALTYDNTHVTAYGGLKLAEQHKSFLNTNKF